MQARIWNAWKVFNQPHHVPALNAPNAHGALIRKPGRDSTLYFSIPGMDWVRKSGKTKGESRKGLMLYKSTDGGYNWQGTRIQNADKYGGYSDMAVFKDGSIALIYETGHHDNYEFMIYKHLKVR